MPGMFVTRSHSDTLHNMADNCEYVAYFPKLEDLCVQFIRVNVKYWKPEEFLGIPGHLLLPILENLDPLEIEKLEDSSIFKAMRIDTNPLWRNIYTAKWPRKSKWPEVYFKTKGITREQELWKIYYLQRLLQEALNGCNVSGLKICSSSAESDDYRLQNIISACARYAAYLRIYNPSIIYLAKNWDIVEQLAECVEFLEIFMLRNNGVEPLCHLLQVFISKRLKSIRFCFCKVNSVELWSKIYCSLLPLQENGCNITDIEKEESVPFEDNDNPHQSLPWKLINEMGNCTSPSSVLDDVNIYEFTDDDLSVLPKRDRKFSESSWSCTGCLPQLGTSEASSSSTSDLFDVVFSCSNNADGHECKDVPRELLQVNDSQQDTDKTSDCRQVIPIATKPTKPLSLFHSSSNVGCSLVHFELTAFWLHQDLLELFVNSLKYWTNLKSLTLEDNGLNFQPLRLSQKLMDTLYLLCTQGELRYLKITNNLVSDSITKFLVEKFVGSFCFECNQESKSLTKFKLSSFQVSEAFCEHLRTAIKDVCFCSLKKLDTSSTHKSKTTDSEDNSLKSECTDQGCSCCGCTSSLGSKRKTKFQVPVKNKRFTLHNGSCVNNEADNCQEDCSIRETCSRHESFNEPGNGDLNFINSNDNCTKTAFDQNYPGSFEAASNMANFTEIPALGSSEIIQFNGCNSKEFVGIQELRLTCPVGDRGASLISDGLQSNSSLLSLSLVNCNISTAGLGDIFNAITGHRSLKHLSVKGNRYDPSRNNKLAEMLTVNKTLTDLNLSSCGLGVSEFIGDIFHALCINSTLTSLKLGENILGDSHIAALSQVFTHPNKTSVIKKLDLSNNPISLEGLSVLASSLECIKPRKLDELKLTAVNILGSKPHRVLSNLQCMVHTLIVERLDKATLFADFLSQM